MDPADFKHLQGQVAGFADTSYHNEVRTLRRGQALITATEATDRQAVDRPMKVDLRPACMEAGGKSWSAVDEDK